MIQEEEKTKKYLIKNDFDVMKGFLEFLKELNKSMVFNIMIIQLKNFLKN